MNAKIKNMLDMAASDGILSSEELRLIKSIAKKENIDWDNISLYILQTGCLVEDENEYDISNDKLIKITFDWLKRLEEGSYEGIAESFPLKRSANSLKKATAFGTKIIASTNSVLLKEETILSKFDKIKLNGSKKIINVSLNFIPGAKILKNLGSILIENILPVARNYSTDEIKIEVNKYSKIIELRVKTKKIDPAILTLIQGKIAAFQQPIRTI